MIPHVIHLCWFGKSEYPDLTKMCIASWEKYLPEYSIRLWNEESFDLSSSRFVQEAYSKGKWAFVSDYVRLAVLYEHGGIYMDTDLEVIKDYTEILSERHFVSSYVEGGLITAGFIACEPKHPFIKELLDFYDNKLINSDGSINYVMNPLVFTRVAEDLYSFDMDEDYFDCEEITILPMKTFMPYRKNLLTGNSTNRKNYHITSQTYTIHHDMGSWAKQSFVGKYIKGITRLCLPENFYRRLKLKKYKKQMKVFSEICQ